MKKILFILFLFSQSMAWAQSQVQYWVDNNFAQRKEKTYTGSSIKDKVVFNTNNLTVGLHQLHIRYRSGNNYSPVTTHFFYRQSILDNLTEGKQMEFWFDTHYTQKRIMKTKGGKGFFKLSANGLTKGLHSLNLRYANSKNHSPVSTHYFYKADNISIRQQGLAIHVWYDNDTNNIHSKAVYNTKFISLINARSLKDGLHTVHVYFTNRYGANSPVESNLFYKGKVTGNAIFDFTTNFTIYDPNPTLVLKNGEINTSISNMVELPIRKGTVTDGISKLLLVKESTEPMKLILKGTNGYLTTLENQKTKRYTLTIQPKTINGKSYIIAIYNPPVFWTGKSNAGNWGQNNEEVKFTWEYINYGSIRDDSKTFYITPPPILLVHGMWGDPIKSWQHMSETLKRIITPFVYAADYSSHGASSFDPKENFDLNKIKVRNPIKTNKNFGMHAIDKKVGHVLKDIRSYGFACARVNMVGHSLGGLMIKSFIKQENRLINNYKNKNNYYKGYCNSLITIGSPHIGSPFGQLYINLHSKKVNLNYKLLSFKQLGKLGICHYEFNPTSQTIKNLKNVNVKSHAIIGQNNNTPKTKLGVGLDFIYNFNEMFNFESNDLIVSTTSQLGGKSLIDSDKSIVLNVCHSSSLTDTTELQSIAVRNRLVQLLLSDNPKLWGTGFNYTPPTNVPPQSNTFPDMVVGNSSKIKLISPIYGSSINIAANALTLIEASTSDAMIDSIQVSMATDKTYLLTRANNFKLSVSTKEFTDNLGITPISATAIDTGGTFHIDTSAVDFINPYQFFNITVDKDSILLDSNNGIESLYVYGAFFNPAKHILKLSHTSKGTVYKTLKGKSIVEVLANGDVVAKGIGTDTIEVIFRDFSKKIPVTVNSVPKYVSLPKIGDKQLPFATKLYPNPNNGSFAISLHGNIYGTHTISVFNALGKKIKEMTFDKISKYQTVNYSLNLPQGLYIIKLENNKIQESYRMVVL